MNGYEEIDEKVVRTAAAICGPHSAAAQALKNAEVRRALGQDVKFYRGKGSIFVQGTASSRAQRTNNKEGEGK